MTSPLSPVPGPEISEKGRLTPPWQSWFYQLYTYLTASGSGGGGTVPVTRQVNTTAPLAGGGALSSDLTLSVGTFGPAVSGVVPSSGGGAGSLLRSDGVWTNNVSGGFSANSFSATLTVAAGTALSAGTSVTASTFLKSGAVAVGSLPAAGTAGAGARYVVTDANATTFQSIVAAGGANIVPVYSDGTNWRIG